MALAAASFLTNLRSLFFLNELCSNCLQWCAAVSQACTAYGSHMIAQVTSVHCIEHQQCLCVCVCVCVTSALALEAASILRRSISSARS